MPINHVVINNSRALCAVTLLEVFKCVMWLFDINSYYHVKVHYVFMKNSPKFKLLMSL